MTWFTFLPQPAAGVGEAVESRYASGAPAQVTMGAGVTGGASSSPTGFNIGNAGYSSDDEAVIEIESDDSSGFDDENAVFCVGIEF